MEKEIRVGNERRKEIRVETSGKMGNEREMEKLSDCSPFDNIHQCIHYLLLAV